MSYRVRLSGQSSELPVLEDSRVVTGPRLVTLCRSGHHLDSPFGLTGPFVVWT